MQKIVLCLFIFSYIMAEIKISGDARFRPRYQTVEYEFDFEDYEGNDFKSERSDFYFLYRARLNLEADISENWFFKTQLATASKSGMSTMGSDGVTEGVVTSDDLSIGMGNRNSYRPIVNFNQLYFGYKSDKRGVWVGAYPLSHHPGLDIHFYPNSIVGLPWLISNNGSTVGAAGYEVVSGYKVNWFLSVDKNNINQDSYDSEWADWDTTFSNHYTLGLSTSFNFNDFVISPYFLKSFGNDKIEYIDNDVIPSSWAAVGEVMPTTFGAHVKVPESLTGGYAISTSYFMSSYGSTSESWYRENSGNGDITENWNENMYNYEIDHLRLSVQAPYQDGKIKFFYDIASKSFNTMPTGDDDDEDLDWVETSDISYIWLSYTKTIYKGEKGSVNITPTFRLTGIDTGDYYEYSKSRFEVTGEIKFK
mgnify:CR=1 FL=1